MIKQLAQSPAAEVAARTGPESRARRWKAPTSLFASLAGHASWAARTPASMDGMPEGTPPGALSESEIFQQARKRKEAAVAELTRLELRVQCVADAYLCASLLDRSNQLKAAVAGAENEMYVSRTR